MNNNNQIRAVRSAVTFAVAGVLIALLFCTLLSCGRIYFQFLPLELMLIFAAVCVLLERLPFMRSRKALKLSLQAVCVIIVGILLGIM